MINLILASKSPFRAMLMKNAGLIFSAQSAQIDERMIEARLQSSGITPQDIALFLAQAKALDVSSRHEDVLVIGSDQTLSLDSKVFHKPETMEDARSHLLELSGRTHQLNSAVTLSYNSKTVWHHVSIARMTMRTLTPQFIAQHLAQAGDAILSSVGAYQFELQGVQLFEKIDGDYFTIVGLPLLPLLAELRTRGAIYG
jgi:septum formation protein